jgi:hypothetical protein
MASKAETIVDVFNNRYSVGTPFRYWRGAKEGEPSGEGKTRSEATIIGGQPVVWIQGCSGCIALTHVEPAVEVFL